MFSRVLLSANKRGVRFAQKGTAKSITLQLLSFLLTRTKSGLRASII